MESEIELGEVITDIAAGPFGSNLKVSCFVPSGFPIIDGANLKGLKVTDNLTKFVTEEKARSLSRSIAKRGDAVVTISGTLGQIAYIPNDSAYEEYLCSQRQFKVTFDTERVYVPYLVYYFHTRKGQSKILAFANQTGVPALAQPTKNFRKIRLNLPPLQKQRQIAHIGELLTAKIEANSKLNGYLEELADALFQQKFGALKDNAVLADIADITMGQSPAGSSYNENGVGAIFYQGRAEFGWRYPTQRLCTTEPKRMAKAGDVLMSVRAPVGDLNLAYEDCCIGRGLAAIHCDQPSYGLYLMRSLHKKLDAYNGEGTVFGSINGKALNGLPVALPDDAAIRAFEKEVEPIDAQIRSNEAELRSLATLRDALLPKLMSGEIDVSKVDLTQLNSHLA